MSKIIAVICVIMLCGIAWAVPEKSFTAEDAEVNLSSVLSANSALNIKSENLEMLEQTGIEINNNPTVLQNTPTVPRTLDNRLGSVLMIPDWTTDSIGLFDPYDGTFIRFLCMSPTHTSPKNAIQGPDGNIYLSDQVTDAVTMFDTAGNYLGVYADASDGLDNIRGIAFRGDHLFVCSYNGTSTLRAVKEFSGPHSYVRDFITYYLGIDPFDILFLPNGQALFADAGYSDKIALHDTNGVFIRTVYGRAGQWLQQVQYDSQLPGAFLAALWDADSIIDFNLDGTIVAACTLTYVKGVYRLGNGNILATCNRGMFNINPSTGSYTQLNAGTGWQYIELYKELSSSYIITPGAGVGGTITPATPVTVNLIGDTTFTITPDLGYHVDSVVVNGVNYGPLLSYRFIGVRDNYSINAYFSINTYTITATATSGGTITPSGTVIVEYDADTTFMITPDPTYHLDSLIVDGINHGPDSTSYTFEDVMADHSINAYFSNTFTITATASTGGTILPSGVITVIYGDDTTFTITPDANYHTDSVVVDGASQGVIPSYTFNDVTDNHTIDAYFSINTFTILATTTPGGTIIPSGDVVVNYGEDTTFTIAPNTDYQLDSVLVDEVSVGAVTSYPFTDVIDDHTIHAMFSMTALPGWTQKESLPPLVKDGGALVGVTGTKDGDLLFAFRGAKSKEFYMYDAGVWTAKETIPFGYKYPLTEPPAINKKYPGKGAAFCYDGVNTIYAAKGNGTWEFWAYDLTSDVGWTAKAFIPSLQKIKGGTSMAYKNGLVYLLAGAQKKDNFDNFFAYDPTQDTALGLPWTTLTGAPITPPVTAKPKPFKDGSALSIIGNTIYAIKGGDKYNFFYAYDIATDIWTELETIPLAYPTSMITKPKKNKVGDGAAMTTDGSILYVIKGKGKQDFWSYSPISEGVWTPLDTIPILHKKSVPKTGAALAYANSRVWLLKGNKTPEFWSYVPSKEKSKLKSQMSKVTQTVNAQSPISNPQSQIDVTPNPFTKLTTIRYTVPISGKVSLKLYNATGRLIETLQDGYLSSGIYSMNLSDIIKGIYFLKYESNTNKSEVKLIVQ